jgi:hypothetical protein
VFWPFKKEERAFKKKVGLANHEARIGNNGTQAHYRLKYRRKQGRCGDTNINGSTH